jgi:hypothetical protein
MDFGVLHDISPALTACVSFQCGDLLLVRLTKIGGAATEYPTKCCSAGGCMSTTSSATCSKRQAPSAAITLTKNRLTTAVAINQSDLPLLHLPLLPQQLKSTSHRDIIKQTILIFEVHDVLYLLDVSLAREHLDFSSAASARKGQSSILSRRFTKPRSKPRCIRSNDDR